MAAQLSFDDEYAAAADRIPFSNGFEGDCWSAQWCDNCVNNTDDGCPLLGVALFGRTPRQWITVEPYSLTHRYRCEQFTAAQQQGGPR